MPGGSSPPRSGLASSAGQRQHQVKFSLWQQSQAWGKEEKQEGSWASTKARHQHLLLVLGVGAESRGLAVVSRPQQSWGLCTEQGAGLACVRMGCCSLISMPRSQCSAKLTYISGHCILSPCLLAYCSGTCSVCSWVHLYLPFTSASLERACWCENCWSACSSVKVFPMVLPLCWTPCGNPER